MAEPLSIWAVSDGRPGVENQALGLAEAVARLVPASIVVKRVSYRGLASLLPARANPFPRGLLATGSDPIVPPWPELWIAAGRASLALSIGVRRWSGGRTFTVQTQDPRLPARLFDLVIPPRHDRLSGENVFSITGAPHRLTQARLAAEAGRFADLPSPRIAVLVGGQARAFDLSTGRAEAMALSLDHALTAAGASLLLTFSRRTPEPARAALTARLSHHPGRIWDGTGENPYFAMLAAADGIAVTEDSINMAAEAAWTGKPVFVLPMDGGSPRHARFHRDLRARGVSRPFDGVFGDWTYQPLRETERAAEEIVRRLQGLPHA